MTYINKIIFILLFVGGFQLYVLSQCVDDTNYWENSWVSCETRSNPNPLRGNSYWINYQFSQPEAITDIHFWNANKTGESATGAKDIIIDYSIDGVNWINEGFYTLPQANESNNYEGVTLANLNGQFVQKILVTIQNNHNNTNCVSLAEVKFGIDENACYEGLDACGVCYGPGVTKWYLDADNDRQGNPDINLLACNQPLGYTSNGNDPCDDLAFGWSEISTIFNSNGCTGCHGGGAAGGLDLRTYEAAMLGGSKCGTNIFTADNLVRIITETGYEGCTSPIAGQSMNDRVGGNIDAEELAMIQAWVNTGAAQNCSSNKVTLFADCDFSGISAAFTEGIYPFSDFTAQFPNDQLSSITIPKGYRVTLYQHDFSGIAIELTADDNCLVDNRFSNITSSIKIEAISEAEICDNVFVDLNNRPIFIYRQASEYINSNGFIEPGADIIYRAGSFLEFNIGFEVKQGAQFEALIEQCNQ